LGASLASHFPIWCAPVLQHSSRPQIGREALKKGIPAEWKAAEKEKATLQSSIVLLAAFSGPQTDAIFRS